MFWQTKLYDKTIQPDIVVTRGQGPDEETFVIDTKWKILDSNKPDDNDLRQIFAYNLYWKSYQGILLYPKTTFCKGLKGVYIKGMQKEHGCRLSFLDLLDSEGKLSNEITPSQLRAVVSGYRERKE